ncbi:MAG: hypothetical protein HY562_02080 [Ignavibacteriales bacterium]|nr:hypothetical protein [Ignavibacteriales bacterium]
MTNPSQPEAESVFKVITVVYLALLTGQLIFLGVVFLLHSQGFELMTENREIFLYVGMVVTLAAIAGSAVLFGSLQKVALTKTDESSRGIRYSTAHLVRLALIEGCNFVNLVFYLLTAEILFLVLFAFGIAAFILARPNRDSFVTDLQHSHIASIG